MSELVEVLLLLLLVVVVVVVEVSTELALELTCCMDSAESLCSSLSS